MSRTSFADAGIAPAAAAAVASTVASASASAAAAAPAPARAGVRRPRPAGHAVSWENFRDAVRYGTANDLVGAIGGITAKRAAHRWLGEPVGPHAALADTGAFEREYERGVVVWTPGHGAAVLHGFVRDVWELLGGAASRLGAPTGDLELDATSGTWAGRFEHGSIDWSPATGPLIRYA